MSNKYPELVINHESIRYNASIVSKWCEDHDITFVGVVKGFNAELSVCKDFVECGAKVLASSRLAQLKKIKESGLQTPDGLDVPLMMIRIPMLSEVEELVQIADYSLVSEEKTIKALNEAASRHGKKHKVVIMHDVGDLREGIFEQDKVYELCLKIESEYEALELAGIGTNLGCTGTVVADENNMGQMANLAKRIEDKIGRKLEFVSGGASTSLPLLLEGRMPAEINMLRIGSAIIDGSNHEDYIIYGCKEFAKLKDDCFVMRTEVVEVQYKPSHPVGTLGVDAFKKKKTFEDKGMRTRAIIAVGRQDYNDLDDIVLKLDGAELIGASGDHTLIDVSDCTNKVQVGDIIEFNLTYTAVLRMTM